MSNDSGLVIDVNVENEQIILGAIINDHETFLREVPRLTDDLFNLDVHKDILSALKELIKREANYAADSVIQLSGEKVKLKYLSDLEDNFGELSEENFKLHFELLQFGSVKYQVAEPFSRLYDALDDPHTTLKESEAVALEILSKLREGSSQDGRVRFGNKLFEEWFGALQELQSGRAQSFCPTYFSALDEKLYEGLKPGKIIVVAGRPGMGKSTFCSNLTLRLEHNGKKVLSVPVEAGTESVVEQMASCKSRVSAEKMIKTPDELTDTEMFNLKRASRSILKSENIIFCDRLSSIDELEMMAEQYDFEVAILDLFEYLLQGDMDPSAVTHQLRRLKNLSIRRGFASVVVHQIRRTKNKRSIRPKLHELKNSGGYEEVADLVLLLHRGAYYNPGEEEDMMEINVAKQRRGPMNVSVAFKFNADNCRIGAHDPNHDFGGRKK
jgi:replicative DNA helicase